MVAFLFRDMYWKLCYKSTKLCVSWKTCRNTIFRTEPHLGAFFSFASSVSSLFQQRPRSSLSALLPLFVSCPLASLSTKMPPRRSSRAPAPVATPEPEPPKKAPAKAKRAAPAKKPAPAKAAKKPVAATAAVVDTDTDSVSPTDPSAQKPVCAEARRYDVKRRYKRRGWSDMR